MLLPGYPPEFREDEYVVNTICSFGRVISWVDDGRHLSRILVRARVVDLESIPQFLVLTEGEGFQGESWTVQCEVLQGQLLGGLPQDEDPVLGPDDFPPRALLIYLVLARMVLALLLSPISRVGLMSFLLVFVEATWDRISSLLMLSGKDGQIMFRRSPILISMRMLRTHQSLI